MTQIVAEAIVARTADRTGRIVRRRYACGYKDYVVERYVAGTWQRSRNGPWDLFGNARMELRSRVRHSS